MNLGHCLMFPSGLNIEGQVGLHLFNPPAVLISQQHNTILLQLGGWGTPLNQFNGCEFNLYSTSEMVDLVV